MEPTFECAAQNGAEPLCRETAAVLYIMAKSDTAMTALGPGCVKTCTSRECAELFSLFSSFDGDCESGSFLIQRNRDKLSTRKFDVGVFTQPGSNSDLAAGLS